MKWYSSYGNNDFVICCGHKIYSIKEYFSNYFMHTSDVTFDLEKIAWMFITREQNPGECRLLRLANIR